MLLQAPCVRSHVWRCWYTTFSLPSDNPARHSEQPKFGCFWLFFCSVLAVRSVDLRARPLVLEVSTRQEACLTFDRAALPSITHGRRGIILDDCECYPNAVAEVCLRSKKKTLTVPVICICTDSKLQKFKSLRDVSKNLCFDPLTNRQMVKILQHLFNKASSPYTFPCIMV